jgi:CO/xanthine dehydrogenase Mo-binding subunit
MTKDNSDIRIDAPEKISGLTRYIRDEKITGMWYGTTVRSPHAHARILDIEFDPAFDWNHVVTVTAKDVAVNYVAMLEKDMPFLADKIVRYVGEPVILIAAPNKKIVNQAKEYVKVTYQPLPSILNMLESENSNIKIYGNTNVFKEIIITRGQPEKAFEEADNIIKIISETGFQEHLYLEPQGVIAIPREKGIEIHGSLQCPYYVKNALVNMFDGKKHITVIQSPTGGAFGGKEDFPSLLAGHAALLADKGDHPVAIFYDREEDVQVTPKRHPSYHQDKAFVTKDGLILGLDLTILLDGGAYCTLSQVVLARTALTALGCYHVPNVQITAKAVATNTVPSGAFRGFGGPQAIFAIEMLIEKIAATLGIRPDEVRRKNLLREGQCTATGQILKYSVSAMETFEDVITRSDYVNKYEKYHQHNQPILDLLVEKKYARLKKGQMLQGIGLSTSQHGAGFTGTGENKIKGKIRIKLTPEGRLIIYSASTEMGQGEQTVIPSILSRALGIDRQLVQLAEVNTDNVPDSGPTVASRTTMIVGSLLIDAAAEIIKKMKQRLKREYNSSFEFKNGTFIAKGREISFKKSAALLGELTVEKQYCHPPIIKFDDVNWRGDAYPVFSWAAAVAEIEVDPVTFEITVKRYTTTHDIGKAINHDQAVAQIEGGSLQGIGYALYEKVNVDQGRFDVTGFTDYIIPTTVEMPEFDVKIMENPYPYGPFGAKGLGELPLVGAAPAVISALWMIFGLEFNRIPVMPEDLAEIFSNE